MTRRPAALTALLLAALAAAPRPARGLEADELALVVNKRAPGGMTAAANYAKARGVPEGRVIELDLPFEDECTFEQFEGSVVPTVRAFLRDHKLDAKVRCLVTFYGVPLRIGNHDLTSDERAERESAERESNDARDQLRGKVEEAERVAKAADDAFAPPTAGTSVADLERRGTDALRALSAAVGRSTDPAERAKLSAHGFAALEAIGGQMAVWNRVGPGMLARPDLPPEQRAKLEATKAQAEQLQAHARALLDRRYDPLARAEVRRVFKESFGLLNYAKTLQGTIDYLADEQSGAAFDSELALLWWGFYGRTRWQPNPLNYAMNGVATPPVLMTCRLDAPEPAMIDAMVATGLKVEHDGITGRIVCDARGKHPKPGERDAYAAYDQTIRNFADLVRGRTHLPLTFDDADALIAPHAAKDVAVYVGWYSVRHYVPSCDFAPGAVGYHVASYELTTLRDGDDRGWCRGLLKDGVVATVGPVAEPYLSAFPAADDFFPLLLTGKLTLAEAYWRTTPMTSWQMCLIGDPLYTPFKKDPALAVEQLPAKLRAALDRGHRAASHPATTQVSR